MEAVKFEAKLRTETGKGPGRRYRQQGFVPAVIYGQGKNTNIVISHHEFMKQYSKLTRSTLVNLTLEGKEYDVVIKECDKDLIKDRVMHIDFYELKKGKPVQVDVRLNFKGNAIGMREGGILEKHFDCITVECLPKDIIPSIDVDITGVRLNHTLHVRDLALDEKKYKVLSAPEEVLIKIAGKGGKAAATEEATEEEE